jgi:hypothetical protein
VKRHLRLLWLIPAIPGIWQLALLASAVLRRWSYPYDLEWMEGGMLAHAFRLAHGRNLYAPPSIQFIPYLYTPLYPAILAALGKIFGLGYRLGRAISILSIAGIVAAGAWAIVREAAPPLRLAATAGAAVFAGFFAATYPWVEGWYDLVRGDTLFLAMGVVGLALVRAWAHRGHRRVAIAAAILGLSFFAKQTGVLFVAGGGAALLVMNWRATPVYALTAGAIGGGGSFILNKLTHGWYWIYVYKVHQQHDTNKDRFFRSFKYILWHFPAMTCVVGGALVVVAALAIAGRPLSRASRGFLYWSWLFACGVIIGALGWATQWAHFNAYIPAMTFGAIACGAALNVFAEESEPAAAAVAIVLGIGLIHARWKPERFVPKPADRAAGDRLIAQIRSIPGEVYVPSHPWYAILAGKPEPYTHRMGILDVTYEPPAAAHKERLPPRAHEVAGLRELLAGKRFAAVVMDDHFATWEFPGLTDGYRQAETLPPGESPRVYTGAPTSPHTIWVAKEPVVTVKGAKVLFDFESGQKEWTADGAAWGASPAGDVPGHLVTGIRGTKFASSLHGSEKATGTLTSPPFTIEGSQVTLRLAGGGDPGLRAELQVSNGWTTWIAGDAGATGDAMTPVSWDVSAFRGEWARIVLVDQSPTGWLAADDVEVLP